MFRQIAPSPLKHDIIDIPNIVFSFKITMYCNTNIYL
jgi:hypothetical protein